MKKIFSLLILAVMSTLAIAQDNEGSIAKTWELKGSVGYSTENLKAKDAGKGLFKGDEVLNFDLGAGYNFTDNWYAGLSTGVYVAFGDENNTMIPALADVAYRHGISSSFSLFLEGRAGFLLGTEGTSTYKKKTYDNPNYGYFDITPGVIYQLNSKLDLKLSVGYGRAMMLDCDNRTPKAKNENQLVLKLGVNFRL